MRKTLNIVGAIIVACVSLFYLLPGCIATIRNTRDSGMVWVINIFLGWTILGWIVALAMSFKESRNAK